MKICTVCKIKKGNQGFFYRNRHTESLHSQCKDCYVINRRKTWNAHYHKYGSRYRARAVERTRIIKDKLRQQMLEYLSDKYCLRCEISDPRVLEFDHINPKTKSYSIAHGIASTLSWKNIMTEIDKCQILCANCHKIKTAQEQGWYKNI